MYGLQAVGSESALRSGSCSVSEVSFSRKSQAYKDFFLLKPGARGAFLCMHEYSTLLVRRRLMYNLR